MDNVSMAKMFNGCFYDAENDEIHWEEEGKGTKACLDCNGLASDVDVKWTEDKHGDWKKMPNIARISVNEGLRLARSQGIGLQDLGRLAVNPNGEVILQE